jgi:phenylalanyl-tRNA synthetase beta chain
MKISLNWICEFVDLPKDLDPQKLATLFTLRTAEVEGIENQAEAFEKMVVGQVLEIHPHPNADKLKITKTSIGKETLQIVCGDPAIYEGMYAPVVLIGAKVHWHGQEEAIILEPTKIRGVESFGMLCAGEEIGLEEKSSGVYDLSSLKPEPGKPLAEVLGKDDIILTVDNKSLTHRPDLWGHYGIAREMAAINQEKLKPLVGKVKYPTQAEKLDIQVKEKKLCPRYIGVKIENIKIEPSPLWMQKRLQAIGYRPINNIVDATNYIMAELGQPLHAFDADKIEKGIVVRKANEGEKIVTLEGVERTLSPEMLVIADHKKALAVAGVMGGANSEISPSTSRILLEAANFNPSSVRKTSVKLGLRTEAVQRFEKSLDPKLAETAMDRLCELILKISPQAKIVSPKTDIRNFEEKKTTVTLDIEKVFSKIGVEIPLPKAIEILESLEFEVKKSGAKNLQITVPTFRATKDISIEDDIVEELARMYGYENIEPKLPNLPTRLPIQNKEREEKHRARQILALGLGFNEVYNYSFYSLPDLKNALLPEEPHLKVRNYLSEDQTHLRLSLLPNLLKNIKHNLKFFKHLKIFEIGRTYENLQEYFPIEEKKITAVSALPAKTQANQYVDQPFYEMKGALEAFLKPFRPAALETRRGQTFCPYAHPNKYLEVVSLKTGETLARVFELHPFAAKNFDLEGVTVAAFEVNFSKLAGLDRQTIKYKSTPKFPGIEFDVSVVIDQKTEIGTLQKLIQKVDKNLIDEVKLFDLYEGKNIPEGKKALAFKVHLQAKDRTLTDQEMKQIQQKIFAELMKVGGEIRGL